MKTNEPREVPLPLVVAILITLTVTAMSAQRPTSPLPSGNRIVAQDGDVVVVENDARVRIVRRRDAYVRAVFNAQERWLILLLDHATSAEPADGRVDYTFHFRDVEGAWPFGARWEGAATIEEYSLATGRSGGVGIATSQGLVQLLGRLQEFRDPNAVAVLSSMGGGSGGSNQLGFDEAERWFVAQMRRTDGVVDLPSGGSLTSRAGISFGPSSSTVRVGDAIRTGGSVRPPVKIVDVPPVPPEMAVRAGIRGIVIVEITINVDGTVRDARVLRSIPLLDAAALEAVKQWRYDPASIPGTPVIMTVSVEF